MSLEINFDLGDSHVFPCFLFSFFKLMFFQYYHPLAFKFCPPNLRPVEIQSRFSQEKNRGRKEKKADCPTRLTHCGLVYCSRCLFYKLAQANTICRHLLILLLRFLLHFNHLVVCCFTFEL